MHTLVHPATPSTASRMETHHNTQSQPAQEGRITTRQGGIKLGGPYCRRPSMPIRAHGPTQARKRAAREHVQPTLLKLQSTSPKSGHFRRFSAKWTAVWDRRPVTTPHQQQSRATPSRDPATASFRSHLLVARAIPLLSYKSSGSADGLARFHVVVLLVTQVHGEH